MIYDFAIFSHWYLDRRIDGNVHVIIRFFFALLLLSAAGTALADFLPDDQCNCSRRADCIGTSSVGEVVPVDFFDLQPAALATAANILAKSDEIDDYELLSIDYCVNDTQTTFRYLVRYNRIRVSDNYVFGPYGVSAGVNAGNHCEAVEDDVIHKPLSMQPWEDVDWPDQICDLGCKADYYPSPQVCVISGRVKVCGADYIYRNEVCLPGSGDQPEVNDIDCSEMMPGDDWPHCDDPGEPDPPDPDPPKPPKPNPPDPEEDDTHYMGPGGGGGGNGGGDDPPDPGEPDPGDPDPGDPDPGDPDPGDPDPGDPDPGDPDPGDPGDPGDPPKPPRPPRDPNQPPGQPGPTPSPPCFGSGCGPGSGGGGNGNGNGNGDPGPGDPDPDPPCEGEECEEGGVGYGSGSGSCLIEPACVPEDDPIQCAILWQIWHDNCRANYYDGDAVQGAIDGLKDGDLIGEYAAETLIDVLEEIGEEYNLQDDLTHNYVTLPNDCPQPYEITALGASIAIPYTAFCDLADRVRGLFLALCALVSLRIIWRAF